MKKSVVSLAVTSALMFSSVTFAVECGEGLKAEGENCVKIAKGNGGGVNLGDKDIHSLDSGDFAEGTDTYAPNDRPNRTSVGDLYDVAQRGKTIKSTIKAVKNAADWLKLTEYQRSRPLEGDNVQQYNTGGLAVISEMLDDMVITIGKDKDRHTVIVIEDKVFTLPDITVNLRGSKHQAYTFENSQGNDSSHYRYSCGGYQEDDYLGGSDAVGYCVGSAMGGEIRVSDVHNTTTMMVYFAWVSDGYTISADPEKNSDFVKGHWILSPKTTMSNLIADYNIDKITINGEEQIDERVHKFLNFEMDVTTPDGKLLSGYDTNGAKPNAPVIK